MTARTKAGVIGWPVMHSLSPALHRYWLRRYGIEGTYDHYEVAPENLAAFINAMPGEGFIGANVTIPHKEEVAKLMARCDPIAKVVGAVNMITVKADGTLSGFSTDGYGFVESLREQAPDFALQGKAALVIGAGGAAKSILHALAAAGMHLTLTNRTAERAIQLARTIGNIKVADWNKRHAAVEASDLVVNTTSLGMTGQPALEIDLGTMARGSVVADCVYAPLQTSLLTTARAKGLTAVDGLGMLIHQARPAFKAWFGLDPEVTTELRDVLLAEQQEMTP